MTGIFHIGQHRCLNRWSKHRGGECLNEGRKTFKVTMGSIFALFILYTYLLELCINPSLPHWLDWAENSGEALEEVCTLPNSFCGPCSYLVKSSRARYSSFQPHLTLAHSPVFLWVQRGQHHWCGPLSHQEVANPQSEFPHLGGYPEHAITWKSTCLSYSIKAFCWLCGLANPGLSLTWLSRW